MPKGAALGYVIPSFPAFSLWFCVGFWQLQAVVGWTTKLSMCFWKCTHIHMYTYIYVAAPQCTCMFPPVCAWPCTAAFSAAEELQGAKVQVSEVGWRGCSSRTCRNEPLCVYVLYVSVCIPWSTEEWQALASAHFRLLSFLFRPYWRKD